MRKLALCLLALALIAPATIMAQSKTGDVTNNLFLMEKDTYINPIYWDTVEKPTVFLQFGMPNETATAFDLGIGLPFSGMYLGANVNVKDFVSGQVGGGVSTRITSNASFVYDGLGNKTSETRTTAYDYNVLASNTNTLYALFGMSLGDMKLGFRNYLNLADSSNTGYFGSSYSIPGGATWTTIAALDYQGTGALAGITKSEQIVEDGVGMVTRTETVDFADGTNAGTVSFNDIITAGITMPLSSMKLLANLRIGLYNADTADFGAWNYAQTKPLIAYAAYTPAATLVLPGKTAAAIINLSHYIYSAQGLSGNSYFRLNPAITALIEMPLSLGYDSLLTAGFSNASWEFRSYGSSFENTAGVVTKVKGTSSYTHYFDFTPGAMNVLGLYSTTALDTRAYETRTYSKYIVQSYSPNGSIKVKPADNFSFAFGLTPKIDMTSIAYSDAGSAVEVETYFDDDGVATGDYDDYVQTTTLTKEATAYQQSDFSLTLIANTGAQFYIVPGKLRVNLGGELTNTMISKSTVTQLTDSFTTRREVTVYGDATTEYLTNYAENTTPTQQYTTVSNSGSFAATYEAGLTYFFSDAMYLDLKSTGADIFAPNNWTLQLVIKY